MAEPIHARVIKRFSYGEKLGPACGIYRGGTTASNYDKVTCQKCLSKVRRRDLA